MSNLLPYWCRSCDRPEEASFAGSLLTVHGNDLVLLVACRNPPPLMDLPAVGCTRVIVPDVMSLMVLIEITGVIVDPDADDLVMTMIERALSA